MVKRCASCGWEIKSEEMCALGDMNSIYCVDCTHDDGSLRSFGEVLVIIADDMVRSQGIDQTEANKMAKETMLRQPAWQDMKNSG